MAIDQPSLEGYVAFTLEAAEAFVAARDGATLTAKLFGPPQHYIPFTYSKENAIKKLKDSGGIPLVEGRELYILHIWLPARKMIEDFMAWRIAAARGGFRLYRDLELGKDNAYEWIAAEFVTT